MAFALSSLFPLIVLFCVCDKVYSRHRRHLPFSSDINKIEKRDTNESMDLPKSDWANAKGSNVANRAASNENEKALVFRDRPVSNIQPQSNAQREEEVKQDVEVLRTKHDPDEIKYVKQSADTRHIDPFVTVPPPMPKRKLIDPDCPDFTVFPPYSTPAMPRHIEVMFIRVTPKAGHYEVGKVPPLGYDPPPVKITECERLYLEHLRKEQYSDSNSELEESLETIRAKHDKTAFEGYPDK